MIKRLEREQLSFQRSVIREEYMEVEPSYETNLSRIQFKKLRYKGGYRHYIMKDVYRDR